MSPETSSAGNYLEAITLGFAVLGWVVPTKYWPMKILAPACFLVAAGIWFSGIDAPVYLLPAYVVLGCIFSMFAAFGFGKGQTKVTSNNALEADREE